MTRRPPNPPPTSTPKPPHTSTLRQLQTSMRPLPPPIAEQQSRRRLKTSAHPAGEDADFDSDFAAALASFDREQAAETAAAQNLTAGREHRHRHRRQDHRQACRRRYRPQVRRPHPAGSGGGHQRCPQVQARRQVEVVVEREEAEGGYLVSYEKALRHKVWDKLEAAANDKTPVKGMVLSRVKGGLTVDIGIKAFLPGSQVEVRPVRNLDGYIGTEIEVRVIKLNKKRGNVVISRKELLEEEQNAKKSVTLCDPRRGHGPDRHRQKPHRLRRLRRSGRPRWPAPHHRHELGTSHPSARPRQRGR